MILRHSTLDMAAGGTIFTQVGVVRKEDRLILRGVEQLLFREERKLFFYTVIIIGVSVREKVDHCPAKGFRVRV